MTQSCLLILAGWFVFDLAGVLILWKYNRKQPRRAEQ